MEPIEIEIVDVPVDGDDDLEEYQIAERKWFEENPDADSGGYFDFQVEWCRTHKK